VRTTSAARAAVPGATARTIRWTQPAVLTGIALILILWQADTLDTPATAVWTVRAAGLIFIAGSLSAFDDPAAPQIAAVPVPLSRRAAPRIAFAVVFVTVPVAALAGLANLPVGAMVLEAGALLALATGACLVLARTGILEPSTPVAVGLLLAPAALVLLPEKLALLVPPGPDWDQAHGRWAILLGVGILTSVVALRDPARPAPRGWHRS
jgi:hypothetical protein